MDVQLIPFILFAGLLAIASFFDVAYRIIPNWVCAAMLLLGLVVNVVLSGADGAIAALAGLGLGLFVFLPFYVMRMMGAGDVKLMAAVGAYLGPVAAVNAIAWTVIIGGVLGFAYLIRRMAPVIAPVLIRYTKAEGTHLNYVPYGVAIAAGSLACQVRPLVEMSF